MNETSNEASEAIVKDPLGANIQPFVDPNNGIIHIEPFVDLAAVKTEKEELAIPKSEPIEHYANQESMGEMKDEKSNKFFNTNIEYSINSRDIVIVIKEENELLNTETDRVEQSEYQESVKDEIEEEFESDKPDEIVSKKYF